MNKKPKKKAPNDSYTYLMIIFFYQINTNFVPERCFSSFILIGRYLKEKLIFKL